MRQCLRAMLRRKAVQPPKLLLMAWVTSVSVPVVAREIQPDPIPNPLLYPYPSLYIVFYIKFACIVRVLDPQGGKIPKGITSDILITIFYPLGSIGGGDGIESRRGTEVEGKDNSTLVSRVRMAMFRPVPSMA